MMSNGKSRSFLARLILAGVSGQSPEDFAEQEYKRLACEWCADGWPVADGQHNVIGVIVPCEALAEALGREEK
jgi:hypothetical protein